MSRSTISLRLALLLAPVLGGSFTATAAGIAPAHNTVMAGVSVGCKPAGPHLRNSQGGVRRCQQRAVSDLAVQATPPSSAGYWHTSGDRIVDADGRPVRIAAVNWFGMENLFFVPAGLDRQPLDDILTRVRDLGFNTIRLPFSNEMVEANPVVIHGLGANPGLRGLHALAILDRIVAAAGRHGLRLILEDARSGAGIYPQGNGLWYTKRYPERSWLQDWVRLAKRYQGDPTVVGVDLRDEPHTGPPGPWTVKAYLQQGSTWGPYRGVDNPATDWRLAAERGGNAVLSINPRLLIFVEGLQLYPDPVQPGGVDSYWWGGILTPGGAYPVRLAVPHQLVYSPHEYGPYKWSMPFYGKGMTYARLAGVWDRHWGFLLRPVPSPAPIFIGEFGTCGQAACVDSSVPGSTGLWFRFFLRYLRTHPQIGWAFWALNGTTRLGHPCPNYILKTDWRTVRLDALLKALRSIEGPPSS
jgi:endoglucanase